VHASALKFTGVAAYLAFVTGLAALSVTLSRHVGTQALAVAVPYLLSDGERPLTLVERRQIEGGTAVAPAHPEIADVPAVLEVPAISARTLAAQLDHAEKMDLAVLETQASRGVRRRTAASRATRPARVAAADVFGRSFGVMLTASR
jgi:hypothetical protein